MKPAQLKISVAFLFAIALTTVQAQTLYVKEKSNTQTPFNLNAIRKITFASGNAIIQNTSNQTSSYALNNLRYWSVDDLFIGLTETTSSATLFNLSTYPNPVTNILNIELSHKGTVDILSIDGKLIETRTFNTNGLHTIDLSHLSTGLYLCTFSNYQESKVVKFIKY
ncbi:MAG: T9SS type A sorting domain-containing protein [Bacteroidia bacterium]|jgi:hypothetical protein|nr:T9SS type A sorting domain-containing protein [Bacteroidia bacterium]